jgi:hypothetical protein
MKEEEERGASLNKVEKEKAWIESENIRVLKEIESLFLLNC